MLISFRRGQGSAILRVKLLNSSVSTGAGLTGLTSASSGLIISTIADNEATATAYTVAASNVEGITTLGTYAAPTSGKCRFKEIDATNHKGVYEIQLADARLAVSNAKSLIVSIAGATNLAECDVTIPLTDLDPYDPVRAGLAALPNAAAEAAGGLYTRGTGAGQINQDANGRIDVNVANAATSTGLAAIRTGTCQSGSTSTTIVIDASASGSDDFYRNAKIYTTGGTGAGQSRIIEWYEASTKTCYVDTPFVTTPDNTTTFAILPDAMGGGAIHNSVLAGGSPSSTQFRGTSALSSTDDFYNGSALVFTTGTLRGLANKITDYTGSTNTLIFATAWPSAPANSDRFIILGRII